MCRLHLSGGLPATPKKKKPCLIWLSLGFDKLLSYLYRPSSVTIEKGQLSDSPKKRKEKVKLSGINTW